MRKLLGLIAAVASYLPIVMLARWVSRGPETVGLIAAGLFLFFGFILCMAIYSAVGIPNKQSDGGVPTASDRGRAPKKPAEKSDPVTQGIAAMTATNDLLSTDDNADDD